jgi:alanine dehydrogenase
VAESVIHFCVPNLTSVVARSASQMLNNAAWPFVSAVADHGLDRALESQPALRRGVATHAGRVINPMLAAHLGLPEVSL